jgi:hypothetical protein
MGPVVFVAAICSVFLELSEYEEGEILCGQKAASVINFCSGAGVFKVR